MLLVVVVFIQVTGFVKIIQEQGENLLFRIVPFCLIRNYKTFDMKRNEALFDVY